MKDLKDWSALDLFNFCILNHIIYPMDDFEEWKNDKELMIKIINETLDGQHNKGKTP